RSFAAMRLPWIAMGGGGYDLDAVRRTWSLEYLVMLGAPVDASLHDVDPPIAEGERRRAVDAGVDAAIRDALAAAFT
ncbi:MAG: hypothetical protein KGQ88_11635, partial [Chloroflexi bacterium]|nr:hypothetical protein [Chloroflexota bacterium]